jgi:hypothetical protein
MDNLQKQTIALAKLNQVLDMILYLQAQKHILDKELKKLEEENKKEVA